MDRAALDARAVVRGVVEMSNLENNARDLELDLGWLARIIENRLKHYASTTTGSAGKREDTSVITPPKFANPTSPYADFIAHYGLDTIDRLALILALAPRIRPQVLDALTVKTPNFDRRFTEVGGVHSSVEGEFVPTGETLAFLLGGLDLATRFAVQKRFDTRRVLVEQGILRPVPLLDEPLMNAPLRISDDVFTLITLGEPSRPDFGSRFPARFIDTTLEWDDLVLHPGVRKQLEDIETYLTHGDTLMHTWGMASKLRPGYRALFYGPPGVGKTMTACVLGKATGCDVYKVDLSLVVSKYIGETEKNLGRVFDQAQHKHWILFFDEGDALFGKRGETKDAQDRFANQEISYLLQKIESFDGVAILATNRRDNLDEAFSRRFESMIYFPLPRAEERLRIWTKGFSSHSTLDSAIDLQAIARDYELSGGSIMNIIRFASFRALEQSRTVIMANDLQQGIRHEFAKGNRSGT